MTFFGSAHRSGLRIANCSSPTAMARVERSRFSSRSGRIGFAAAALLVLLARVQAPCDSAISAGADAVSSSGLCGAIWMQGGNGVFYYGANFNVKFCTQTDGTQCVGPVVADTWGNYSVPASQSANFYMYAWRDDIYWGSATQPLDPFAIVYVASGYCQNLLGNQSSRPRPNPPGLVAPAMNATVPYNAMTLQWKPETDPRRVNSNWPIVYDLYTAINGGAETLLASNIPCCSRTVAPGVLPAGSAVNWRVVAKMNTKVGGPWDQNYSTTSPVYKFSIPFAFDITSSPSGSMYAGQSAFYQVFTTDLAGTGQTISFTTENLPPGVTGGFSPSSVKAGQGSTLSLNASGNAPAATNVPFTIKGTAPSGNRTVTPPPTLTVIPNGFSLALAPSSQSVDQGKSTSFTVSTALTSGLAQTISLSVSGLPSYATGVFSSSSVAAGQSATLTIATATNTPAALATITVTGTAASGAQSASATLNVLVPRMPVIPVQRVQTPIVVTRGTTTTGTVVLGTAAPAGGVTVSLSSSNPSVASVPASVFVPAGATVSQPFNIVTSGAVTSPTTVTITATYQGSSASTVITVSPPAFQGYHDACDCYGTTGWAWDANQPNTPINVDIYVDGAKVGTVAASGFRQDLLNAGIGNGYHGFGYNLPTWVRAGSHTVTAKYSGTQTNLGTTPKSITCETANVVWIQPQTTAGFGPPGSLIVAGHAQNAPSGTGVQLYWRDITAGGGWNLVGYAPPPDSTNTWYNSFPANFTHSYSVYVVFDAVNTSATPCAYGGNNTINWCP